MEILCENCELPLFEGEEVVCEICNEDDTLDHASGMEYFANM
jgi:uncharacterized Zn finger protein (UPF0148 family)